MPFVYLPLPGGHLDKDLGVKRSLPREFVLARAKQALYDVVEHLRLPRLVQQFACYGARHEV